MAIRESTIKDNIIALLRTRGIICWRQGAGPYAPAGLPDIMGILPYNKNNGLPGGRLLGIEVKTPAAYKTKNHGMTELQSLWLSAASGQGALAFCADSVEEVKRMLDDEGY